MVLQDYIDGFVVNYRAFTDALSPGYASIFNVFVFAILIVIYALFIWKFYKYVSKKDLIELNLSQYNRTTHPVLSSFFAWILYLIEYMVILPFLIFFWFGILALIILLLSSELGAMQVIMISASLVAAIRILSYYEERLAEDLAKILPFTILAIFVTTPSFFSVERIISNLIQVPNFLNQIVLFLVFIVCLEFILRIIDLIIRASSSRD